MIKYTILAIAVSCATNKNMRKSEIQQIKAPVCRNTLQYDIHRDMCMRDQ